MLTYRTESVILNLIRPVKTSKIISLLNTSVCTFIYNTCIYSIIKIITLLNLLKRFNDLKIVSPLGSKTSNLKNLAFLSKYLRKKGGKHGRYASRIFPTFMLKQTMN